MNARQRANHKGVVCEFPLAGRSQKGRGVVFALRALLCVWGLTLATGLCCAEDDVEDLKAQIQALQERVEQLEAEKAQRSEGGSARMLRRRPGRAWDPFSELERMQEEMDRMFQNSFTRRGLGNQGMFSRQMSIDANIDLKETPTGYEITLDMTGLDQEKIDIQIHEHAITVKGEHSRQELEQSPSQVFRSESFGSFMKTIPLPVDADTTKVKTEKKGDDLVLTLPKKQS